MQLISHSMLSGHLCSCYLGESGKSCWKCRFHWHHSPPHTNQSHRYPRKYTSTYVPVKQLQIVDICASMQVFICICKTVVDVVDYDVLNIVLIRLRRPTLPLVKPYLCFSKLASAAFINHSPHHPLPDPLGVISYSMANTSTT